MLLPFLLFAILVVWALIDNDLYAKEAIILGSVWLALLLGLLLIPNAGLYCVVPIVLIDVWLLVKLIGNPSVT